MKEKANHSANFFKKSIKLLSLPIKHLGKKTVLYNYNRSIWI